MYAQAQDISDEFKGLVIGGTNPISESLINRWIEQESNYIDAKVALRYKTPVLKSASPLAYSVLLRICIFRVSERVKNKMELKSNVSQLNVEQKYTENYVRTPNYDLDQISLGKMKLIDATLLTSTGGIASPCTPPSIECSAGPCHTFDPRKQQW